MRVTGLRHTYFFTTIPFTFRCAWNISRLDGSSSWLFHVSEFQIPDFFSAREQWIKHSSTSTPIPSRGGFRVSLILSKIFRSLIMVALPFIRSTSSSPRIIKTSPTRGFDKIFLSESTLLLPGRSGITS